jgi:hypothetical protein
VCVQAEVWGKLQVPDGPLHLWLYQTESLVDAMDETLIAGTFRISDDKTIPGRDDSVSDFFYGTSKQSWCVNQRLAIETRV